MKTLIYALGLGCSLGVQATVIQKHFPVSTYIDKAALYPYTLNITPKPARLALVFNDTTEVFETADTLLQVDTDIPESEAGLGFGYNLSLVTNISECRNATDKTLTQSDFISLKVDGQPFTDSTPVLAQRLETPNAAGNLSGENTLTLESAVITNIMQVCTGRILVEAELAL